MGRPWGPSNHVSLEFLLWPAHSFHPLIQQTIQGLAYIRAWASQNLYHLTQRRWEAQTSPSKHILLPPGKCKAGSCPLSLQSEDPQCVYFHAKSKGNGPVHVSSWLVTIFHIFPGAYKKSVSIRWFTVSLRNEGVLWKYTFSWSCADRELWKCLTKI